MMKIRYCMLTYFFCVVLMLFVSIGCNDSSEDAPPPESTENTPAGNIPADTPPAVDYSELFYNEGGFNIPGMMFQPIVQYRGGRRFEPVEVFKNVYFIGDAWTCCLLYVTDEGIIMWDSLESAADMTDILQPDMEKLGLDIANIKICLVSHDHGDLYGGPFYLQKNYGTKVYGHPWNAERFGPTEGSIDKYIVKDQTITLGDVTFTIVQTPGKSEDSLGSFVPVTAFDGTRHTLTCWGGTSTPRTIELVKFYRASIEKWRKFIKANGVDALLCMHPYIDATITKINTVRETGSSDALIMTPAQMDFFCDALDVYTLTKLDIAAAGIQYPQCTEDEFIKQYGDDAYGFGSRVLSMPFTTYIPEDGKNGYRYLNQIIRAEIFDNVYLVGTGKDACLIYDTADGIVITDAMTGADDFTKIVKPAMRDFGLDPKRITAVMITNGNADKVGFASYLRKTYGAKIYMNQLDAGLAADLTIDVNLVEDTYTSGQFTFDWVHTPGHTDGCMSYHVNVAIDDNDHTAACWGGTTFAYEQAKLKDYCDSIDKFLALSREKGADAMVSTHPYFDYSVEKVLKHNAGDKEAFILNGDNAVAFALTAISMTAHHMLKTP